MYFIKLKYCLTEWLWNFHFNMIQIYRRLYFINRCKSISNLWNWYAVYHLFQNTGVKSTKTVKSSSLPISILNDKIHFDISGIPEKLLVGPSNDNAGPTLLIAEICALNDSINPKPVKLNNNEPSRISIIYRTTNEKMRPITLSLSIWPLYLTGKTALGWMICLNS